MHETFFHVLCSSQGLPGEKGHPGERGVSGITVSRCMLPTTKSAILFVLLIIASLNLC